MEVKIQKVTPAQAAKWINKNTSNRSLRPGVVEKYARDMENGTWTQCAAPIAFYEDGELADGQHRLFAIVEADVPQNFVVITGLSRNDGMNIDTGLGRSIVDNARISGKDTHLSNEALATARALYFGVRSGCEPYQLTAADRLKLVEDYRAEIDWAMMSMPKTRGMRNSLTLAAVARAIQHEKDDQRLAKFCEIFATGFNAGESDSAAVAIRNYLIANPEDMRSPDRWESLFRKMQNAIWYFMRGKPLRVIKETSTHAYPLISKG